MYQVSGFAIKKIILQFFQGKKFKYMYDILKIYTYK